MSKVYHEELSTSLSQSENHYPQVCAEKTSRVRETCGQLFLPFVVLVFLSFIFALYIFMNLSMSPIFKSLKKSNLEIHFLNVGQGDAILIEAPNGNSMLIDSGPQNEKVIAEVQKFKNVFDRRLDILLATHADADHIGSMKKVIEKFNFQKFAYSGLKSDTKLFQDLMSVIGNDDALVLTAGMSIVLDEKQNIRFDVLFPDFDFQINEYEKCRTSKRKKSACIKFLSTETNLNSIVGRLSYGETAFMLTGDAPMEVEKFIISKFTNSVTLSNGLAKNLFSRIQSDVLKLGHHGSKTSTSPEFLTAVSPSYAIVSAGKDNRYGHPHKRVLDAIEAFKKDTYKDSGRASYSQSSQPFEIFRTDIDGTISFYSDGFTVYNQL